MVSKICLNMKLTPPCIPLPQCNKTLGKDKVTCGFYIRKKMPNLFHIH